MSQPQTKILVEIMGEQYPVKGDVEPERVMLIADMLNQKMRKIAQSHSRLTPQQVAVVTAMNLADEYLKLEEDYQKLMQIVKKGIR